MYEFLTYQTMLIQAAVFLAVTPFVIVQMRKRVKLDRLCSIMYDRCVAIVDEIKAFDANRSAYLDELYWDFRAIGVWDGDPAKRLKLYTAFADKWEAKIAGGEILRTWGTEKQEK